MKFASYISLFLAKYRRFTASLTELGLASPFAGMGVPGLEARVVFDGVGELLLPPVSSFTVLTSMRPDKDGTRSGSGDPAPEEGSTTVATPAASEASSGESRAERRTQHRIPFDDKVEIWQRNPDGRADRYLAWGLNISSGGIRVIFTRLLNDGECVGVQLRPDRQALPARVAWVKPQLDGCIAGLTFTG